MNYRLSILIITIVASYWAALASIKATDLPEIVLKISELQTASLESASQEYVELYNPSAKAMKDLPLLVEYRSANGTNWSKKAEFTFSLAPRDFLLVATEDYDISNQTMKSGLALNGGHIRLTTSDHDVVIELDRLGWGSAIDPEGLVAPAPQAGESLKRRFNEDGKIIDSDQNFDDFFVSTSPYPQTSEIDLPEVAEEETPNDDQDPDDQPVDETSDPPLDDDPQDNQDLSEVVSPPDAEKIYYKITISELLVDPVSPQTDKDDEYIELFNPQPHSVDVTGYEIKTGLELRYSYKLPKLSLKPGEYFALYSVDSGLSLANSSGKAVIYDPNGKLIYETADYEKAKPGLAWAYVNGSWQWLTPSPHALNVLISSENDSQSATLFKRQVLPAIESTSPIEVTDSQASPRTDYQEPEPTAYKLNNSTLVVIFSVAILYGAYEYRQEIKSLLSKLKFKLGIGKSHRQEP